MTRQVLIVTDVWVDEILTAQVRELNERMVHVNNLSLPCAG